MPSSTLYHRASSLTGTSERAAEADRTVKVSIIVPVKNERQYITQCMDSIFAQEYPREYVEILIVDGMSNDGTRDIVKAYCARHKSLRMIDNPAGIVPAAMNIGVRHARGEFLLRMDGHAAYAPDYVQKCVDWLQATGADNVGGPVRAAGAGYIASAIALAQGCRFGLGGAKFRERDYAGEADTVFPGAWRKETFKKYGYFDERLHRNQDIEFNTRIKKGGGRIFITPEIRVTYFVRSTLAGLWKQNYNNGKWNIATVKVNPGALSARHFVPLCFVASLMTLWVQPFLWYAVIAAYAACAAFFCLQVAVRNGLRYMGIMPVVFLTLHLSYGLGSLRGLLAHARLAVVE